MRWRPSFYSKRSSKSYPDFHPHVTLLTFQSTNPPSLQTLLPPNIYAAPVSFKRLWVGNTYLGSLSVSVHRYKPLLNLHGSVLDHLDRLGIPPKSRGFHPHVSLFYLDETFHGERQQLAFELRQLCRVKEERLGDAAESVGLICPTSGPPRESDFMYGFTGAEIWLVDCNGSVREWEVLERRILGRTPSRVGLSPFPSKIDSPPTYRLQEWHDAEASIERPPGQRRRARSVDMSTTLPSNSRHRSTSRTTFTPLDLSSAPRHQATSITAPYTPAPYQLPSTDRRSGQHEVRKESEKQSLYPRRRTTSMTTSTPGLGGPQYWITPTVTPMSRPQSTDHLRSRMVSATGPSFAHPSKPFFARFRSKTPDPQMEGGPSWHEHQTYSAPPPGQGSRYTSRPERKRYAPDTAPRLASHPQGPSAQRLYPHEDHQAAEIPPNTRLGRSRWASYFFR